MNDAEFWQKCIPQAERQKLKKDKQEELIVYGKRKTRNNLFLGQIFDSGLDAREERFGRGRSRGGGGGGDLTGGKAQQNRTGRWLEGTSRGSRYE